MKKQKNKKHMDKNKSFYRRTIAMAIVVAIIIIIFLLRLIQFQLL